MATDATDSPHRTPGKVRCTSYYACAEIDKWAPPADIHKVQSALESVGTPHRIEWYAGVEHGVCAPLCGQLARKASCR